MEKGSFDVEAHNLEVVVVGKGKQGTNTAKLHNGGICFAEVFRTLTKSLGDKSGFLFSTDNGAIRVVFEIICPTDADSFSTRR